MRTRRTETPLWLKLFSFALMGPACGINAAFIALAMPSLAPFGLKAVVAAGLVGVLVGIFPAYWLSSRIATGLAESSSPERGP